MAATAPRAQPHSSSSIWKPVVAGKWPAPTKSAVAALAGPIVAAAVVFDYSPLTIAEMAPLLSGLGDSKKLTAKARERLFPLIIRHACRFSMISCRQPHNRQERSACDESEDPGAQPRVALTVPRNSAGRRTSAVAGLPGRSTCRSPRATPRAPVSPPRRSSPRSPATV